MLQLHKDPHFIEKFTIYGERHSGTNFVEQCFKSKFGLDITYFFGFKHWMGFCKPELISYRREVLFIGIVRNPYDWLLSFFNAPHHVPRDNCLNIKNFLTNEWYSLDHLNNEIMGDRNYTTQPNLQRYKNIFELRKQKCIYLSQIMPVIAKNYILLSYDNFLKNYDNFLNIIKNAYHLKTVGNPPTLIPKNSLEIDPNIKKIIDDNLDWAVEESLGFYKRP